MVDQVLSIGSVETAVVRDGVDFGGVGIGCVVGDRQEYAYTPLGGPPGVQLQMKTRGGKRVDGIG